MTMRSVQRSVSIACLVLAVAACGGDDDTAVPSEAPSLTPEVVCVSNDFAVYFASVNGGATPVVVDGTGSSRLDGALADDEPLVPVVFAAGRVSPAFFAFPAAAVDELTWTIEGPDGETRVASADSSTPACTDELLAPTTADTRAPTIVIDDAEVDGDTAALRATLAGVPETSVCPPGLEPEPVEISMDDGVGGEVSVGSGTERTAELFEFPGRDGPTATFVVAALVVDRCTFDGVTTRAWPGGAFDDLRYGLTVCVTAIDDAVEVDSFVFGGCGDLPPTGGVRIRPN